MLSVQTSPLKRSGSESNINKISELPCDAPVHPLLKRFGSDPDLRLLRMPLDRLPSASPYVGTFHRGFKASKGGLVHASEGHPDKLWKSCPYVIFHRGYTASSYATSNASTEDNCQGENENNADAAGPSKCADIHTIMEKIDFAHLPKSPELCGLQAILPRQCGVRILDKLGEGSFGKVVLAVNKRNRACWTDPSFFRKLTGMPEEGDSVVLKCVRKESCYGARGLQCIAREVEIHSRCCHPNISRMYGYYENGQYVTMILEFIDGKELFEVLRVRRQLPEEEACLIILQVTFETVSIFPSGCDLCIQVLRGVNYLHEKSIVHRDLTPRNIMLKNSKHAFIIDLGLAVDLSAAGVTEGGEKPLNSPVGAVGTMGYIPPDVMRNEKVKLNLMEATSRDSYTCAVCQLTPAVDIWAVGVVLYESVFGFPPFSPHEVLGDNPVEFPDPAWGVSSDEMQSLIGMVSCDTVRHFFIGIVLSLLLIILMAICERCRYPDYLVLQMLDKSATQRCSSGAALSHPWFTSSVTAQADALAPQPAEGDGVGDEPPPLWLGGDGRTSSGGSSSSELEPETPPGLVSPLGGQERRAARAGLFFGEEAPPSAGHGHGRALPVEPAGVGSLRRSQQCGPRVAPGPESSYEPEGCDAAVARGADAGKTGGKVRRECVLRLDGEIKCDAVGAEGGEAGGEAGNVVYVARILNKAAAA
jgi:serine/threonine protein kinase